MSIDEMAAHLIGREQPLFAALDLAHRIKASIRENVGSTLRCSIGLAPNRYLAKIASDTALRLSVTNHRSTSGLAILRQSTFRRRSQNRSLFANTDRARASNRHGPIQNQISWSGVSIEKATTDQGSTPKVKSRRTANEGLHRRF